MNPINVLDLILPRTYLDYRSLKAVCEQIRTPRANYYETHFHQREKRGYA